MISAADLHCGCGEGHPPRAAGGPWYYTSVQAGTMARLLSGPYRNHPEARAALPADRAWAWAIDPRGPWYAYGTARSYAKDLKTVRGGAAIRT